MIAWLDWYHQNISLKSNSSPEQRKQPRESDSSPGLHAVQILFIGPPVSTLIKFLTAERHLDEGLWIFQNQHSDTSSAVNKLVQHNLLRPVADAVHASDPFHLIRGFERLRHTRPWLKWTEPRISNPLGPGLNPGGRSITGDRSAGPEKAASEALPFSRLRRVSPPLRIGHPAVVRSGQASFTKCSSICTNGGIGIRARLRIWCPLRACEFDSHFVHHS